MQRSTSLFRTTIGLKITMAVSGIVWVGFVIGHMLGNLKVYLGRAAFNHYAEGLRVFGEPFLPREGALWIFRVVLIVALVLHVWSAWKLTRRSHAARDVGYRKHEAIVFNRASRTICNRQPALDVITMFAPVDTMFSSFRWASRRDISGSVRL